MSKVDFATECKLSSCFSLYHVCCIYCVLSKIELAPGANIFRDNFLHPLLLVRLDAVHQDNVFLKVARVLRHLVDSGNVLFGVTAFFRQQAGNVNVLDVNDRSFERHFQEALGHVRRKDVAENETKSKLHISKFKPSTPYLNVK